MHREKYEAADPAVAATVRHSSLEAGIGARAKEIGDLSGWRRYASGIAAGAVSVLAMPPFFLWPVLLITLPVLVWLIDGTSPDSARLGRRVDFDRKRLLLAGAAGWCFGFGFHVAGLYWLREAFLVTGGGLAMLWPLGVLGLPAYLAIYHGLAAAAAFALAPAGLKRVAALAMALGMSEWLRGHAFTGFPWNVLGMAMTGPLTLMQSAAVLGIYGLTVAVVVMTAGPGVVLATSRGAATAEYRTVAAALLAAPLAAMLAYGALRLRSAPPPFVEGVRLRLVQPSIPQREKWLAEKQPDFIARHIELMKRGPDGNTQGMAGITHVIWPEAAMPFLPLQRPQVLAAIGEALPDGVHLMAGILRMERRSAPGIPPEAGTNDDYRVFNSFAVFADDGRPISVYDKTHLVPFGEYLPFQGLLEGIGLSSLTRQRGGFAIGPSPRPLLEIPGLPGVGPLICYEAIFPGTAAMSVQRPHVLINATNDGWFGNSTGPRQHLHQSRLRSVEDGLPLLRVANNGITAVYDAYGRELARIDLDVAGVIDTGLPGRIHPPVYARLGDMVFMGLCIFIFALLMVV